MARPGVRRVEASTDWTAVMVAVVLSVLVAVLSVGLSAGHSSRLDRLEKDNALQQTMIKELGQKVNR